jgi:hypothetical protein
MKTKDELRTRARAIAESYFYSDDDCEIAWEPFEDYPDGWLQENAGELEYLIYQAMKWAQEK